MRLERRLPGHARQRQAHVAVARVPADQRGGEREFRRCLFGVTQQQVREVRVERAQRARLQQAEQARVHHPPPHSAASSAATSSGAGRSK
jgi:hypothetical protein